MYILLTEITNYENVGLKSVLIGAVLGLGAVCRYLYKSKEVAIKEKDEKIMAVIRDHQNDIKEANNDLKDIMDKYHKFTESLKEVLRNG